MFVSAVDISNEAIGKSFSSSSGHSPKPVVSSVAARVLRAHT